MSIRAKIIIVTGLSLVLATIFSFFYLSQSSSQVSSAELTKANYIESIEQCTMGKWNPSVLRSVEVIDCQADVTETYFNNNKAEDALYALAEISKEHPDFWIPCHDLLHKAGQGAVTSVESGISLLRQVVLGSCQAGAVHGILDGIALYNPNLQDFENISKVCADYSTGDQYVDGGRLSSYCADGMGHAAWSSKKELKDAVAKCEVIENEWSIALCAEGIMMQIFAPANDVPYMDINKSAEIAPDMCKTWPAGTESASYIGCNKGAAYVYTRAAWDAEAFILNRKDSVDSKVLESYSLESANLLKEAIDTCKTKHEGSGRGFCLEGVSWQIPDIVVHNSNVLADVCSLLEEHEKTCLEMHLNRYTDQDGYDS